MSGYKNEGYEPDGTADNNNKVGEANSDEVVRRENLTESQLKKEKMRIMKNVIVISFSFLLLFTAFQSMAALQSSINRVSKLCMTHFLMTASQGAQGDPRPGRAELVLAQETPRFLWLDLPTCLNSLKQLISLFSFLYQRDEQKVNFQRGNPVNEGSSNKNGSN